MRIAIDARFLGASSYGLAQYSENLLLALSQADKSNEYTVYVSTGLKRRLKLGHNFEIVPVRGRPLSVNGIARMQMALRREDFDLLHVHFPLCPLRSPCPALITVHDVVPFTPQGRHSPGVPLWDRIGGTFLYPMTMHRARWILCVSHATRRKLVEVFPYVFHKTIVVESGVEEAYRRQTESETSFLIRSHLQLPEPYLLYSGSLGVTKNIPPMIDAFAKLRAEEPKAADYHLVLDVATANPRELATIQGMIERFGLQSWMRVYSGLTADERRVVFERASLLFITSMTEGFCFPAIRAQLSRVPVVAADAGALPEVCGEGSLLVDPANVDEMVRMLGRALFDEELREYLKVKGLKNAERFSWPDTAKEVKEIYELLF